MTLVDNHEADFINSFVDSNKRSRYLSLLESKKGRQKLVASLDHFAHLRMQYATLVPEDLQTPIDIAELLKKKGAPEFCHVMSANSDIDNKNMLLSSALDETVGNGFGTVISCRPGRLAYFEGEEPNYRYVLELT